MLTFLSPAALWALAALALPLALHLWRQPPRTIRLGSLRFLQVHQGRRVHDLRWRERFLLWVRLGLLATLVCILARPTWQSAPSTRPQRWILLDPAAALSGQTLDRFRALQAAGASAHLLTPGFPLTSQLVSNPAAAPTDFWSLLREADTLLPPGSTLTLFSPARLASLRGVRPALRANVEWVETSDLAGNVPRVWLELSLPAMRAGQSPHVMTGYSDAGTIRFSASVPDGWKLQSEPGRTRLLGPKGKAEPWIKVRAEPLRVLLFHGPERAEDAHYLAAAVRTAVEADGKSLDLQVAIVQPDMILPSQTTDWTFWLSAAEPPAALEDRSKQFFRDAPKSSEAATGWIVSQPDTPGALFLTPPVRLWQRAPAPTGTAIWTDAQGVPLLTRTRNERGVRWQFASRFHPAWTDLPRTTAFPAWLRSLILPDTPFDPRNDLRLAAPNQAKSSSNSNLSPSSSVRTETRDLHWIFWTLAACLFVAERFLSHRRALRPAILVTPMPTVAAVR